MKAVSQSAGKGAERFVRTLLCQLDAGFTAPPILGYEPLFIEGLAVFEHVVDGHAEFVGDEAFGFLGAVLGFEFFIILLDGWRIDLGAQDDFREGPFEMRVADFVVFLSGAFPGRSFLDLDQTAG